MSRITRFAVLFSFLGGMLLMFACEKENTSPTVIVGKVTDKKTGVAVKKAYIYCSGLTGPINHEKFRDFSTYTDNLGNYALVIPSEYRFSFQFIEKTGYLTKLFPIKSANIDIITGDSNIVDIQLIPTDGFLLLKINNITSQKDSIYVKILSPTAASEGSGVRLPEINPTIISQGDTYMETFALPSEETVYIYWNFEQFEIPNSLFKGSIFLAPTDTTEFIINF